MENVQLKSRIDILLKYSKKDVGLSVLGIATIMVTFILSITLGKSFFSINNFQSMMFQISEFGFLALGMSIAMLTGGIDLSIVSNAGLSGVLAAFVMSGKIIPITDSNQMFIIILAIVVAITNSILCGLVNGVLIAKISVPPIIATLGTMILFNGIGMALTNGESVGLLVDDYWKFGTSTIGVIPYIFIIMVITMILINVFLSKHKLGKQIYLIGENKIASLFSGQNTERIIIRIYMIIGFLSGIASLIMISRVNSARMGFGDTYQLQAILVAVLAGYDPNGGKGKVLGVVLGITLLQFLQSAFTILNFTPYSKKLIWGSMLLIVMIINYFLNKERKPRKVAVKEVSKK